MRPRRRAEARPHRAIFRVGMNISSPVETGRGAARSAVEGAMQWSRTSKPIAAETDGPSTTLRVVPLPRYRGDGCEDASRERDSFPSPPTRVARGGEGVGGLRPPYCLNNADAKHRPGWGALHFRPPTLLTSLCDVRYPSPPLRVGRETERGRAGRPSPAGGEKEQKHAAPIRSPLRPWRSTTVLIEPKSGERLLC